LPSRPVLLALAAIVCALLAAACSGEPERVERPEPARQTDRAGTPTRPRGDAPSGTAAEPEPTAYGFTYGQLSGNRLEPAPKGLSGAEPVNINLNGGPAWVVGVPIEEDTAWVVAYGNGGIASFRLDGAKGEVTPYLTAPDVLPPESPPAVSATGERLELLEVRDGSLLTHPVPLDGGLLGVSGSGELVGASVPGVRAVPDARPVVSEAGAVALLTDPTTEFEHYVLGDEYEASSMTVFGNAEEATTIRPESGGVFEAISPIWFRPAPDEPELLAITESVAEAGTRISVYDPDGGLVAAGPYVGGPQQWRHLMAVAPFGPEGEVELVATRTPHLDATTELYRLEGDELRLVERSPGYPTHTIYSRNLDAARAADVDGDGEYELVVPDQDYSGLAVLERSEAGMEPARTLPLDLTLSTNIASTTDSEGNLYLAAGTVEGVLTIFR
jgi:hypothetical protein